MSVFIYNIIFILGDDAINADPTERSKCADSQTRAWRAIAAFEDKVGKITGLPEPRTNWMKPKEEWDF